MKIIYYRQELTSSQWKGQSQSLSMHEITKEMMGREMCVDVSPFFSTFLSSFFSSCRRTREGFNLRINPWLESVFSWGWHLVPLLPPLVFSLSFSHSLHPPSLVLIPLWVFLCFSQTFLPLSRRGDGERKEWFIEVHFVSLEWTARQTSINVIVLWKEVTWNAPRGTQRETRDGCKTHNKDSKQRWSEVQEKHQRKEGTNETETGRWTFQVSSNIQITMKEREQMSPVPTPNDVNWTWCASDVTITSYFLSQVLFFFSCSYVFPVGMSPVKENNQ